MRFERVRRPPSLPLLLTRGDTIELTRHTRARHTHMNENKSKTPHTRDTHTHHDDTTGPEGGDCMLVGGGCGTVQL